MTCLPSIKVSVGAQHYHVFQDLHSYLSLKFLCTASLNLFLWVGSLFLLLWFRLVNKCQHFSSEGQRIK